MALPPRSSSMVTLALMSPVGHVRPLGVLRFNRERCVNTSEPKELSHEICQL